MSPDQTTAVTLGEVSRSLEGVEKQLETLTVAVNTSSTKSAADYVRIGHLEARIVALEDWQKWAMRVVLGLILTAVVGVVILDPFTT